MCLQDYDDFNKEGIWLPAEYAFKTTTKTKHDELFTIVNEFLHEQWKTCIVAKRYVQSD